MTHSLDPVTDLAADVVIVPRTAALSDDERQPCEVWTRVMGYHRPVASFNTGKKGEFLQRRHFEEGACELAPRRAEAMPA